MSKLDELIWELCPDGVEFKALKEIATVFRGGDFQKKDFIEKGFPCIHYGQIYMLYGLFADKTFSFISEECARRQKIAHKNDIIMAVTSENLDDVCKCMAWLGDGNVAISGHSVIIRHNQNAKFLTYFFQTEMFSLQKKRLAHGTKVVEISPDKLLSIVVPVPPLPVQQEIVRILDNFTLLTAELTAELTARKKQYAYYRDSLLSFEIGQYSIEWKTLEEIFQLRNGYTPSRGNKEYWENGTIPWFRMDDIRTNGNILEDSIQHISSKAVKRDLFPANSILLATSATVGEHALITVDSLANQRFINCSIRKYLRDRISPRYLYYYFYVIDNWCKKNTRKSNFPTVDMEVLKKYKIPLPPLDVQQRIVDVLDNFEKICSDLNIGLPAEIEARKKQYEYYRDALLTFAETGDIIFTDRQTDRQTESD